MTESGHRSFWLEVRPGDFVAKRSDAPRFALEPVGAEDWARARHLWVEAGRGFWTERHRWRPSYWRRHLEQPTVSFFAATRDGEDIGFFELRRRGRSTEIKGIGLLPPWRSQGLGGLLLTEATELAFASGASRVWLHTATDDHPNALPNYRARGYRVFREAPLHQPVSPAIPGAFRTGPGARRGPQRPGI